MRSPSAGPAHHSPRGSSDVHEHGNWTVTLRLG
jgi:hypothetical protein